MGKFAEIILENNENLLIKKLIRLFKTEIKQSRSKRFSFVLTGGVSPIYLYKNLSKDKKIPWKKIDFFISDERYVNKNSKNSNIKMCKKYLLDKIKISKNQIYEISTDKISVKKSAIDYEDRIKKYFLKKKVCFNLTLLGMGKDGHIASLFKNNIKKKTKNNVVSIKKKDFSRISLSLKCINNSKIIFLWIPGRSKSNIIKQILKDKKFKYPASFLRKKNTFLFHSN